MIGVSELGLLNSIGVGNDIDKLESYIANLQDSFADGEAMVDDGVYDKLVAILKDVRPESEVLNRNWERDGEDEDEQIDHYLIKYGMASIKTISEKSKLSEYISDIADVLPTNLVASVKLNGHAIRAVYKNGNLEYGTTRGRTGKGRDITRHLKLRLPNYVADWAEYSLVEIRGEVLVKIDTFDKYLKDICKTPLSSVTSLIRESATDNEIKMLDVVCYKIMCDEMESIDTLLSEYKELEKQGFDIPRVVPMPQVGIGNIKAYLEKVLEYLTDLNEKGELEYSCDGVVVAIDNKEKFYALGKDGNHWKANMAMKLGRCWEQNVYSSTILEVVWEPGKLFYTPIAKVSPVVTANGSTVSNVPLYNVGVMERYGYTTGKPIFFRYGGETGVTTCDYNGKSVRKEI